MGQLPLKNNKMRRRQGRDVASVLTVEIIITCVKFENLTQVHSVLLTHYVYTALRTSIQYHLSYFPKKKCHIRSKGNAPRVANSWSVILTTPSVAKAFGLTNVPYFTFFCEIESNPKIAPCLSWDSIVLPLVLPTISSLYHALPLCA